MHSREISLKTFNQKLSHEIFKFETWYHVNDDLVFCIPFNIAPNMIYLRFAYLVMC